MKRLHPLILCGLAVFCLPILLHAQSGMPGSQSLGEQSLRAYTHVFIAYTIAWAIILGWAVSLGRRLGKIQRAFEDQA
jgi:CcmD family protein